MDTVTIDLTEHPLVTVDAWLAGYPVTPTRYRLRGTTLKLTFSDSKDAVLVKLTFG